MDTLKSVITGIRFIAAIGIWFITVVLLGKVFVLIATMLPWTFAQVWGVVVSLLVAVYLGYLFFTKSIILETWIDRWCER